jgi:hypothetical protein
VIEHPRYARAVDFGSGEQLEELRLLSTALPFYCSSERSELGSGEQVMEQPSITPLLARPCECSELMIRGIRG